MALIIADRVKETATTTGTGTFTLGGAVTGFRTFNAGIGTGNTTYYCIFLDGTNEFEVGLGTYTAPDQLARDTVLASSNSGSKVNFSQGIKSVFCTQPSSKAAYLDASGNLSITTSNITEGTNLYYTDARFDTRLATKDTADLSEGTNLYYTDARARAAISVSGNAIAYNSSTGVITANFEESPTFTGNVVVSGNLTVTGTTTWLDSTNTQISDKNIVLNYASGDSSANADGAGITIQDAVDASTDASLTWNATNDVFEFSHGLDFGDNERIRLGNSQDLQIYHDGSNNSSYIKETGAGSLYIEASNLILQREAGTENFIDCITNGAVSLYYDGVAKLATTSTGIDVTGGIGISGSLPKISLTDSDVDRTAEIYANSDNLFLSADVNNAGADSNIQFHIDGAEKARLTSDGRLGIGTTSPDATLELSNSSTAPKLRLSNENNTITAGSDLGVIEFYSGDDSGFGNLVKASISAIQPATTPVNGELVFKTSSSSTSLSEAMRIDASGNVGIGTTSPSHKLDVSGNARLLASAPTLTLQDSDESNVFASLIQSSGSLFVRSRDGSSNGSIIFQRQDGSATTESARIDSSGNVGIGTSSPLSNTNYGNLTLSGTTGGSLFFADDGVQKGMLLGNNDEVRLTASVGYLRFDTGGNNERMRIDSSGRLLIGGTSTSFNDILRVFGDGYAGAWRTGTSSTYVGKMHNNAGKLALETDGSRDIQFGNSTNTQVMYIDTSEQNVGIGTTSPSAKLHVSGADAQILATGDNAMALHQDAAWRSNMYFGAKYDGSNEVYGASNRGAFKLQGQHDGDSSPQFLAIYGADQGTAGNTISWNTVGFAQDEDGNVGIGTTSPSAPLHITNSTDELLRLTSTGANSEIRFEPNTSTYDVRIGATASSGQSSFYIETAGSEKVRVTNAGNVGIGTTSPSSILHLKATTAQIKINSNDGNSAFLTFGDASDTTRGGLEYTSDDALVFENNNMQERMRIDSSGNLLVGTTDTNVDNNTSGKGVVINGENGLIQIAREATAQTQGMLMLNTTGVDANMIEFKKDASSVGAIGTVSGDIYIAGPDSNHAALRFAASSRAVLPVTHTGSLSDNTTDLGQSSAKFKDLYLGGNIELYDGSNNYGRVFANSEGLNLDTVASRHLIFKKQGTETMRIDTSGNVGIGTGSPSAKLDVAAGNITAGVKGVEISGNTTYIADGSYGTSLDISHNYGSNDGSFRAINIDLTDSGSSNQTLYGLYVDAQANYFSGNVGIGVTSAAASDAKLTLENGFNDCSFYLGGGGDYNYIRSIRNANNDHDLAIGKNYSGSSDTEYLRLANGGNVGIGTSSPSDKLTVNGNLSILSNKIYNGSASNSAGLDFGGSFVKLHGYNGIVFYSSTAGVGSQTERMRITNSGNVGIGTTSPTAPLDVRGNTGGGGTARIIDSSTESSIAYKISGATSGTVGWVTGNASDDFFFYSYTLGSQAMTIKPTGNVGIGTQSPSEKLDIDGDSIRLRQSQTPASATATGSQGQIAWDSNYMYVCVATNTWKRVALSTW